MPLRHYGAVRGSLAVPQQWCQQLTSPWMAASCRSLSPAAELLTPPLLHCWTTANSCSTCVARTSLFRWGSLTFCLTVASQELHHQQHMGQAPFQHAFADSKCRQAKLAGSALQTSLRCRQHSCQVSFS